MNGTMLDVPAPVEAWAREAVAGACAVVAGSLYLSERTRPLAEARTWCVHASDGVPRAWLKRHRTRDKVRREAGAYERWLAPLRDASAPFLGVCPADPSWLLTVHVPGVLLAEASLSPPEARAVWRNLGHALRRLHTSAKLPPDEVPLHEALAQRARAWSERAGRHDGPPAVAAARARLDGPWPTWPERVPCHRDVWPHNVLVSTVGGRQTITLIDFGQARGDVWLADLVKLWSLRPDPACWSALLEGYGRGLTPREVELFDRLSLLHAVGTWAWARAHGAPARWRGVVSVADAASPRAR